MEHKVGDIVNVEGVVVEVEDAKPFGAVMVEFPFCTDHPNHEMDGVTLVAPAVIVTPVKESK